MLLTLKTTSTTQLYNAGLRITGTFKIPDFLYPLSLPGQELIPTPLIQTLSLSLSCTCARAHTHTQFFYFAQLFYRLLQFFYFYSLNYSINFQQNKLKLSFFKKHYITMYPLNLLFHLSHSLPHAHITLWFASFSILTKIK